MEGSVCSDGGLIGPMCVQRLIRKQRVRRYQYYAADSKFWNVRTAGKRKLGSEI
jgi:hypothetical protein